MRKILQPFRFVFVLTAVVLFICHMWVVYLFVWRRWQRATWSNHILAYYSRLCLWLLGVRVHPIGSENRRGVTNALYVGNHLTYLDVLAISGQVPAGFVTSTEIRETPGLGLICEMAGCLFVERRNRANLMNEVAELTEGLRHGLNVAIFPEATSTNGEQVLRFRRPLYLAAVEAEVSVIPFCLNYRSIGGHDLNRSNRDMVFWYGDMDFVPHLWALAGAGGVIVDLHFLPPISADGVKDPSILVEKSQAAVVSAYRPV